MPSQRGVVVDTVRDAVGVKVALKMAAAVCLHLEREAVTVDPRLQAPCSGGRVGDRRSVQLGPTGEGVHDAEDVRVACGRGGERADEVQLDDVSRSTRHVLLQQAVRAEAVRCVDVLAWRARSHVLGHGCGHAVPGDPRIPEAMLCAMRAVVSVVVVGQSDDVRTQRGGAGRRTCGDCATGASVQLLIRLQSCVKAESDTCSDQGIIISLEQFTGKCTNSLRFHRESSAPEAVAEIFVLDGTNLQP